MRVEQGRDDEAVPLFERAITPDDGFALPHFNLGVLYEKRGDVARRHRAVRAGDRARAERSSGPSSTSAGSTPRWATWTRRGSSGRRSLESNPGFVQGRYYLAKLLMDTGGDLARAEKLVREGIELDPEHEEGPLGYYVLADLLNRSGRAAEAREAAAKGREIQAAVKR